ncbi:hypothetical protein [Pseudomonas hormoni]
MSEVMRWNLKGFLPGVDGVCKAVMRPEVVLSLHYDAERLRADTAAADANEAERNLAALREDLDECDGERHRLRDKLNSVEQRLAAAEQRNATCNAEIVAMVESALRRSFSLGQVYWQQADSDSTCQQNKSDQTMEVQAQHILNVIKSINDLTKPTESGASE